MNSVNKLYDKEAETKGLKVKEKTFCPMLYAEVYDVCKSLTFEANASAVTLTKPLHDFLKFPNTSLVSLMLTNARGSVSLIRCLTSASS